jgi:hypothetical protein
MRTPLTPDEESRFIRNMAVHVAEKLAAGESFRISNNSDLDGLWRSVTSLAAERLARPVTGVTNGREFFISLPDVESLES